MDRRIVTLRYRVKEDNFSQKSRLDKVLSDGSICGLIREAEVVVAAGVLESQWRQWCCSQ